MLIRGPTGRLALVVAGRADAVALVSEVADHLAVWEHRLDSVVVLDQSASKSLNVTLGRYPAGQLIEAGSGDAEIDAGGGVNLEVAEVNGNLLVSELSARSAPTTSAARPGSPD